MRLIRAVSEWLDDRWALRLFIAMTLGGAVGEAQALEPRHRAAALALLAATLIIGLLRIAGLAMAGARR